MFLERIGNYKNVSTDYSVGWATEIRNMFIKLKVSCYFRSDAEQFVIYELRTIVKPFQLVLIFQAWDLPILLIDISDKKTNKNKCCFGRGEKIMWR